MLRRFFLLCLLGALFTVTLAARNLPAAPTLPTKKVDPHLLAIENQVGVQELKLDNILRNAHPRVETYIQEVKWDPVLGWVPTTDNYFFGRMDFNHRISDTNYLKKPGFLQRIIHPVVHPTEGLFKVEFSGKGFAGMMLPDPYYLNDKNYHFHYLHQEFLGNVRCYVFNLTPRKHYHRDAAFLGRIWVEAQHDNIVRVNGRFLHNGLLGTHFQTGRYPHFDSWRIETPSGIWVPAYIYSEEVEKAVIRTGLFNPPIRYRSETRLWGYDNVPVRALQESTDMVIHTSDVQNSAPQDYSPLESERLFSREAENNYLDKLFRAGIIAPDGPVDRVLETVVQNLMVTNNIQLDPPIRCRVLLTLPFEVDTVGHTIVISRGLLDVLPDEASLAMVLAHGLARISLGYQMDNQYGFSDKTIFPNREALTKMRLNSVNQQKMAQIDARTIQILQHSPYAAKLASAGLFLRALNYYSDRIPSLMQARLGDPLAWDGRVGLQMLQQHAPALQWKNLNQIEALPLGSRIKLDSWNDAVSMMHTGNLQLLTAADKMPFGVTPLRPYLLYWNPSMQEQVASVTAEPPPPSQEAADAQAAAATPSATAKNQPAADPSQ